MRVPALMKAAGIWLALLAGCAWAGEFGTPKVVWRLEPAKIEAAAGQTVQVKVIGKVPPKWHVYSTTEGLDGFTPTAFTVEPAALFRVNGKVTHPPPIIKNDEDLGRIEMLDGEAVFTVPLQVVQGSAEGEHAASLKVSSQLCDDKTCLLPRTDTLILKVTVKGTTTEEPLKTAAFPPQAEKTSVLEHSEPKIEAAPALGGKAAIDAARQEGLWAYLALAFGTGLTALLTPCVFPMIPITVSFFTKRKQATRAKAIGDAGIYALGIVGTFVFLGFVVSLIMGASGVTQFAANPWVNLTVAAIFIALALNLFGVFEIALPVGLLSRLDKKAGEGEGFASILLMAFVFSITSFTCTVPFIGFVMVSATQGEWLWPLLGMFAFSAAFGLPFCILALFPAMLKALPKSGGWLNSVKVVMGFVELAAALKFLSNADLVWSWGILTREFFLCLWIAIAALTTLYLLGLFKFSHDSDLPHVGGMRIVLAVLFLGTGFWLGSGLVGGDLGELDAFVPPRVYPGREGVAVSGPNSGGVQPRLSWHSDLDAALAEAKATGKPVFVDFTGITCVNCRLMQEKVFPQPAVRALLEQFVRAELYTDKKEEAELSAKNLRLLQERFKVVALPYYVILTPDDREVATFGGFTRDIESFKTFLKRGLEPQPAATTAK